MISPTLTTTNIYEPSFHHQCLPRSTMVRLLRQVSAAGKASPWSRVPGPDLRIGMGDHGTPFWTDQPLFCSWWFTIKYVVYRCLSCFFDVDLPLIKSSWWLFLILHAYCWWFSTTIATMRNQLLSHCSCLSLVLWRDWRLCQTSSNQSVCLCGTKQYLWAKHSDHADYEAGHCHAMSCSWFMGIILTSSITVSNWS